MRKGSHHSRKSIGKLKLFRHTEEAKLKIGLARIGCKHTEEAKLKMSIACKGRKVSKKTRHLLSLIHKGNTYCLGRKYTDETKHKMSLAQISKTGKKYVKGYVFLYSPNHPNAHRKYVPEHRLVMEKHLGRYLLPAEVVHHKGARDDNRLHKLKLYVNQAEHIKSHVPKGSMIGANKDKEQS